MADRLPKFYEEETGMFSMDEELKVAKLLGEEVDNPKNTFKKIENIYDERLALLQNKLYDSKKDFDLHKNDLTGTDKDITENFDNIENEVYYKIKASIGSLHDNLEELDAESLLLQKQITTLKKEKVDLLLQINAQMNKLDLIEKDLGINIAAKRAKKNLK